MNRPPSVQQRVDKLVRRGARADHLTYGIDDVDQRGSHGTGESHPHQSWHEGVVRTADRDHSHHETESFNEQQRVAHHAEAHHRTEQVVAAYIPPQVLQKRFRKASLNLEKPELFDE
jgi:hypothetical protein